MALQQVKLQLVGIAPLLMHNNQLANPLNHYAKALKKLTGKRNKTEADHLEISRLEWEGGLYLHEGKVVLPTQNIQACFIKGAKKSKRGVKMISGTNIQEIYCPLEYKGSKIKYNGSPNDDIPLDDLDQFYPFYNFQTIVVIGKIGTLRTRPIFHDWSAAFTMAYDDTVIEEDEIIKVGEDAGALVGLGDWRPRFGRFMVEKL